MTVVTEPKEKLATVDRVLVLISARQWNQSANTLYNSLFSVNEVVFFQSVAQLNETCVLCISCLSLCSYCSFMLQLFVILICGLFVKCSEKLFYFLRSGMSYKRWDKPFFFYWCLCLTARRFWVWVQFEAFVCGFSSHRPTICVGCG